MIREAYPFFADFVSQWNYDQSPVPLDPLEWMKEIPGQAHVVLDITVTSRQEALKASEQVSLWNDRNE